jgi:hypothetical protein
MHVPLAVQGRAHLARAVLELLAEQGHALLALQERAVCMLARKQKGRALLALQERVACMQTGKQNFPRRLVVQGEFTIYF